MIQLYLHEFLLLLNTTDKETKPFRAAIPHDFAAMCRTIECQVCPAVDKKKDMGDAEETLEDLGEEMPAKPADGRDPKKTDNPFDRTILIALGEFVHEGGEEPDPWLERACKLLIRHPEIRIERYHWYSSEYHWRFVPKTMPERWSGFNPSGAFTVAALLAYLAVEIRERLAALGD